MPYLKNMYLDSVHLVNSPAIREKFYYVVKSSRKQPGEEMSSVVKADEKWLKENIIIQESELNGNGIMENLRNVLEPHKSKLPVDFCNVLWQVDDSSAGVSPKQESESSSKPPETQKESEPAVTENKEEDILLSPEAQEYLKTKIAELASV